MGEFFKGWRRKAGCVALVVRENRLRTGVSVIAILALVTAWGIFYRGVLPSNRTLLAMRPSEIRNLVVAITPIGTTRSEVEQALLWRFHRKWKIIDNESARYMSQLGFNVPVNGGDYYLRSTFAQVGFLGADVLTVRFLFDQKGTLKDVSPLFWTDSL